jgi:hypothetical protein
MAQILAEGDMVRYSFSVYEGSLPLLSGIPMIAIGIMALRKVGFDFFVKSNLPFLFYFLARLIRSSIISTAFTENSGSLMFLSISTTGMPSFRWALIVSNIALSASRSQNG